MDEPSASPGQSASRVPALSHVPPPGTDEPLASPRRSSRVPALSRLPPPDMEPLASPRRSAPSPESPPQDEGARRGNVPAAAQQQISSGSVQSSGSRKEGMPAAPKRAPKMLYGEALGSDERIKALSAREHYLLTVVIPRIRTLKDAIQEWCTRSTKRTVWVPCVFVVVLQVGAVAMCAFPQCSFVCAYGPDPEDDEREPWHSHAFSDYGPPMINVLASLMLSFYANVCMGLYKEGYLAAQSLKASVVDLMAMVAGTVEPEYAVVRHEFWRCVNLYHLCSYVLADKSRQTYNMDNFLLPVATAYGLHDGVERFGMLHRDEMAILLSGVTGSSFRLGHGPATGTGPIAGTVIGTKLGAKGKQKTQTLEDTERLEMRASRMEERSMCFRRSKSSASVASRGASYKADSSRSAKSDSSRSAANEVISDVPRHPAPGAGGGHAAPGPAGGRPAPGPAGAAGAVPLSKRQSTTLSRIRNMSLMRTSSSQTYGLVNSRGDVSSTAAVLHAALGIRMYMLVDLVISEKLSRVAWPAWNSVCLKVRNSSELMKQRSLFRLPRIYQASVRFLVASTILTDTVVLSSHAARLIRHGQDDIEWRSHAYLGAAFDVLLNLLLTWCLTIFIDAVSDMQTPFGGEQLDMPGLSYVCASAELSLRMVHRGVSGSPESRGQSNKILGLITAPLDREAMLKTDAMVAGAAVLAKAESGRKEEEEEEDE